MDSGYPEYTFFNIPHGTDVAELARKHNMEHKWYQIYTQANAEKNYTKKIQAYGTQAFLPIRIVKRQWSDRVKTKYRHSCRQRSYWTFRPSEYNHLLNTIGISLNF